MALSMIWIICLHTVALEKEAVLSEERKIDTGNSSACLQSASGQLHCCQIPSREKAALLSPVNSIAFPYLSGQQSHYLLVI